MELSSENNGETHGYRWRDGIVRTTPEPPEVTEAMFPMIAIQDHDKRNRHALPAPTKEQYAKAYAAWVKALAEWRVAFDAWEAKHGKR